LFTGKLILVYYISALLFWCFQHNSHLNGELKIRTGKDTLPFDWEKRVSN